MGLALGLDGVDQSFEILRRGILRSELIATRIFELVQVYPWERIICCTSGRSESPFPNPPGARKPLGLMPSRLSMAMAHNLIFSAMTSAGSLP